MFMDDDDEFGELYSDILPPQAVSSPNPNPNFAAVTASSTNPNSKLSSVSASSTNPDPDFPCVPALSANRSPDLSAVNAPISAQNPISKICSSDALDDLIHGEPNEDWMPDNWDDDEILEENSNAQPESREKIDIPSAIQGEDWDSDDDSEDDLKIVLNDDPIGGVETDEVENEDKLMAYDNNESNQDGNQDINDGDLERNEDSLENTVGLDGSKANEAARYGVGNFGQQQQSMFKYVRPGATVVDVPGQIRPLGQTVGLIASHGRGEWRSGFGPKSFGSGWANNASRPFGGGLDFTLPSYKTIFDFDIEVFEEKRWRHPGVDISDYFNFGLNEESWKVYARQVDQLRIESTMQSKIRVHESDRSKQEYDPDLPPELAAAAGNHDISANILNSGRIDNGQPDLNGQGRGSPYTLPVGRPIQVETGNGERMPFAETRPPRPRDPDVIIEVFRDDHLLDDTTAHDNSSELPDKDIQGEKCNSIDDADYDGNSDSDYANHSSRHINGSRREKFNDRHRENDSLSTHRGRSTDRPSHRRHERANEDDNDCQKETRENSMAANKSPNQSPAKTVSPIREPSTELADDTEDKLVLDDNTVMEDEGTSDSITRSSKSHKLSSRVEPTNRDDVNIEANDLGNIPSETNLQDGRWRDGNMRRYTNEYVRERRNEMMDRKRISSRAYETKLYPNRMWEQPYPVRPVRGPERLKESDAFWRERKTMVNERNDKDDGFKIRERSSRVREWKDEDYHRREKAEKGEIDRCRREKDKKVEDQYHNSRHKDDSYREREVEDKHKLKHSYDDHRSRRAVEKDDNQFIDKRQQKENEDYHSLKRPSNKERSSRVHNSRPSDIDKTSKETHKESTRKNKDSETQYSSSHNKRKHEDNTKDSEASAQYSSSHSKRKHEDNANREKASSKQIDGQQKQEKDNHKHEDENDTNRESRRGRSKVERWSSDIKEVDIPTNDDIITSINEPTKTGGNSDASHPDGHLDPETLEKLKRRRERFKTPLTSEKDTSSNKKLDKNDQRPNQNETHIEESEVKHERPPRKRRWTSN